MQWELPVKTAPERGNRSLNHTNGKNGPPHVGETGRGEIMQAQRPSAMNGGF